MVGMTLGILTAGDGIRSVTIRGMTPGMVLMGGMVGTIPGTILGIMVGAGAIPIMADTVGVIPTMAITGIHPTTQASIGAPGAGDGHGVGAAHGTVAGTAAGMAAGGDTTIRVLAIISGIAPLPVLPVRWASAAATAADASE